jgi:dienelactone hydrolase
MEPARQPIETFGAALNREPVPALRRIPLAVRRDGGTIPALVWLPPGDLAPGDTNPRAVVLVGHGAGGHKAAPIVQGVAGVLARHGCAALSIDLPYHGDRTPPDEVGLSARERRDRMGLDAWRERNAAAVPVGVADWQAALDAAHGLAELQDAPVGYFGLSLGARFGVPLVAAEPRITASVLGLWGYVAATDPPAVAEAARQITTPVLFLLQWDDELYPRAGGLALFDLLGSRGKRLHASPGRHLEIPPDEITASIRFLADQLSGTR